MKESADDGTSTSINVSDVNCHLICTVCRGYLVDATTITECLHSCEFFLSSILVVVIA